MPTALVCFLFAHGAWTDLSFDCTSPARAGRPRRDSQPRHGVGQRSVSSKARQPVGFFFFWRAKPVSKQGRSLVRVRNYPCCCCCCCCCLAVCWTLLSSLCCCCCCCCWRVLHTDTPSFGPTSRSCWLRCRRPALARLAAARRTTTTPTRRRQSDGRRLYLQMSPLTTIPARGNNHNKCTTRSARTPRSCLACALKR